MNLSKTYQVILATAFWMTVLLSGCGYDSPDQKQEPKNKHVFNESTDLLVVEKPQQQIVKTDGSDSLLKENGFENNEIKMKTVAYLIVDAEKISCPSGYSLTDEKSLQGTWDETNLSGAVLRTHKYIMERTGVCKILSQ